MMTDSSTTKRDYRDAAVMGATIALTYDTMLAKLQRVLDLLHTPAHFELNPRPAPEALPLPDFVDVRGINGDGISPLWITISDAEGREELNFEAVQQMIKDQPKQQTPLMKPSVSKKATTAKRTRASSTKDKLPSKKQGKTLPELDGTPGILETVLALGSSVKDPLI